MGTYKINKGLDLPILGEPRQAIEDGPQLRHVALLGADYVGMKPTMHVAEGDRVKRGQLVFEDKKNPGVRFTAPASGKVVAVHRGARRAFQSLVIEVDDAERAAFAPGALKDDAEQVEFESFAAVKGKAPEQLTREQVRELLLESGLWTALRARPFGYVADPGVNDGNGPHSIFVTAMDTEPLAPSVDVVLAGKVEDLHRGVEVLRHLTDGAVHVCRAANSSIPVSPAPGILAEIFDGPHPAGTPGVHIHFVDPVHRGKTVWHIGYQDAVAIGRLFATGRLDVERVIALAGPPLANPRLVRTRIGASTTELLAGEDLSKDGDGAATGDEHRVISGSVLSGTKAQGNELGYLGRYHNQISVLREDRGRDLFGWMAPGGDKFSLVRAFLSAITPERKYAFTTTTNGDPRAIVPIGLYEKVMPMDILPTFLLRSLVMGDLEQAEALGCLELTEEDLALCTFVCPGKNEYGPYLREVLTTIEKEG